MSRKQYHVWSDAEMESLRQHYANGLSHAEAAKALSREYAHEFGERAVYLKARRMGIGPETAAAKASPGYRGTSGEGEPYQMKRVKRDMGRVIPITTAPSARATMREVTMDQKGEDATVETSPQPRITTLEQLLDAANVDTDVWEVERHVVNKWETGVKGPDGAIVVEPLFQVKAWLKRAGLAVAIRKAGDSIVERIEAIERGRAPAIVRHRRVEPRDGLFVCTTYDLHIGKLAWHGEVGESYDSRIAVARAEQSVEALAADARHYKPTHVLYPFGQDLLHADNRLGTTTNGTPQDRDSRYEKMIDVAHAHTSWAIRRLADEFGSVEAVLVTGNHARGTEFSLAKILEAEFRHDPRVRVDTSPALRKYRRWGVTLLGLAHGDGGVINKLPQLMPLEAREEWAEARYAEWLTGHTHTSKRTDATPVSSTNGVVVRVLRSLSGPDAWHYANGFVGEPAGAEGYVYDAERGLRANLVHYCSVAEAERVAADRAIQSLAA